MAKKKSKEEKKKNVRKEALEKLESVGEQVYEHVSSDQNPFIEIPLRSLSNVHFDEEKGLVVLGDKTSKRYFFNVAHAKKFMQTMMIAAQCKKILDENVHISIRDLYYTVKRTLPGTKENTFDEQRDSDPVIEDLEVTLDLLREQLHLQANRRGYLVGNITLKDAGDKIDCRRLGSGGWAIPSNVEADVIDFADVDADFVLVVEKNAVGDRLNEDKFWKDHKCILLTTQGQGTRGTRRLIHRLHKEEGLPVYVFTDADAYGYYIYSVIKQGSINLAYLSSEFATPDCKFIGLTISDVEDYGLQQFTIKANEQDTKRAKELLEYPWFKNKEWENEIKLMVKRGIKAEQEALSGKRIKFVSEEYLPDKIKSKAFLP